MKNLRNRTGRINNLWMLLIGSASTLVVLIALLKTGGPSTSQRADSLTLYCAAGIRVPVEQIIENYRNEYGVKVEVQWGGSNTLLNMIEVDKFATTDLYLAADDFYTDLARQKGLAAETLPIAHQRPVIAVRNENVKQIASLEDLLRDDVTVVIANPEQAAIGRAIRKRLQSVASGESNLWERLEQNVTKHGVFKPTVTDAANDIRIGSVDAGIVWDSTVAMPKYRDHLRAIPVAQLDSDPDQVTIAVLNSSRQPTEALRFARYLTARDRGLPAFEEYGFRPVEGDVWQERPSVTFYCGAVNRRAVDKIVTEFSEREGVDVNTVYDGCGILTSRMKTIAGQKPELGFPDVYMACDVYYLDNVREWFQDAANVSDTEIVIAVPKGSTKVTGLADLIKPGIRVAVGEPDQCTIGALTRRLLVREGYYDPLKAKQQQEGEVVVEKASSALLVPDVVTGHVDAALAYVTDTLANRDTVDVVHVNSPLNIAVQPFSIAKTSDHKYLLRRLFRKIANSPEAFRSAGFHFRLEPNTAEKSGTDNT